MTDQQPKLLNQSNNKQLPDGSIYSKFQGSGGGPIFESRPGWGFYVKRWFGKYFFKIILPAVVIIIIISIYISPKSTENGKETITPNETIKIMVLRGDGPALAARRALAEYLKSSPEELTAGQKIFIEEILRQKITDQVLIVGDQVKFTFDDIGTAIEQSKQLTEFQLQKWEEYAKKVKFD